MVVAGGGAGGMYGEFGENFGDTWARRTGIRPSRTLLPMLQAGQRGRRATDGKCPRALLRGGAGGTPSRGEREYDGGETVKNPRAWV